MIRWKALIRDVIIIFVLTALGGIIVGIAAAGGDLPMAAIALSSIIFCVIGFCVAGCMAKLNRFRHLFHVAVAVWLFNALDLQKISNLSECQQKTVRNLLDRYRRRE